MYKQVVTLALVVAFVGLFSAQLLTANPHHGGYPLGSHKHRQSLLKLLEDSALFKELRKRGIHIFKGIREKVKDGHGLGLGLEAAKKFAHKHKPHHARAGMRPGLGAAGLGAGLGLGAGAGFDDEKELFAGLGSKTDIGGHASGEAENNLLLAGENHLNAADHKEVHDDLEGTKEHQAINRDQTFIRDKTTGVNQVDAFRKKKGASSTNTLSLGNSGLAKNNLGGRIQGGAHFNQASGAAVDATSDTKAGIGAGAGVGVGAVAAEDD